MALALAGNAVLAGSGFLGGHLALNRGTAHLPRFNGFWAAPGLKRVNQERGRIRYDLPGAFPQNQVGGVEIDFQFRALNPGGQDVLVRAGQQAVLPPHRISVGISMTPDSVGGAAVYKPRRLSFHAWTG